MPGSESKDQCAHVYLRSRGGNVTEKNASFSKLSLSSFHHDPSVFLRHLSHLEKDFVFSASDSSVF